MRYSSLLTAGVSLLGLAAALPEVYAAADTPDLITANQLGKREELCNGTVHLDPKEQPYVIQPKDTLTLIAEKFNRGICDIAKRNNITNIDYIKADDTLIIPGQACIPDSTSCTENVTPTATCINGGPGFYIVQVNDTLGQISRAFKLTLESVENANKVNIPNPDLILVGQVVNIPLCEYSHAYMTPYPIKEGDTFFLLAKKYHSTEGQIHAVNPGVNPNNLQPGQIITLVSDARKAPGYEIHNEL